MKTINNLTLASKKALFDIIDVCGNCGNSISDILYYRSDLYTWFEGKDVMKKHGYTRESIGGFMSHLSSVGFLQLDGDGGSVTIEGIEYAISLLEAVATEESRLDSIGGKL